MTSPREDPHTGVARDKRSYLTHHHCWERKPVADWGTTSTRSLPQPAYPSPASHEVQEESVGKAPTYREHLGGRSELQAKESYQEKRGIKWAGGERARQGEYQ